MLHLGPELKHLRALVVALGDPISTLGARSATTGARVETLRGPNFPAIFHPHPGGIWTTVHIFNTVAPLCQAPLSFKSLISLVVEVRPRWSVWDETPFELRGPLCASPTEYNGWMFGLHWHMSGRCGPRHGPGSGYGYFRYPASSFRPISMDTQSRPSTTCGQALTLAILQISRAHRFAQVLIWLHMWNFAQCILKFNARRIVSSQIAYFLIWKHRTNLRKLAVTQGQILCQKNLKFLITYISNSTNLKSTNFFAVGKEMTAFTH